MSHTRFGFQARNTPAERRAFFDLIRNDHRTSREMEAVVEAIEFMTPTAWTAVTFQNSWQNYSAAPWREVQYRKVGDEVQLRGMISRPAGDSTSAMFTLPTGFRPLAYELFTAASASGLARLYALTTGVISVESAAAGYGTWISLSNIRFSVEN